MKFFCITSMYVHLDDICHLNVVGETVPDIVREQITPITLTTANQFSLVRFDHPEQIEFFESIDWIYDFDMLNSMSNRELKKLRARLIKHRDQLYAEFNRMPKELVKDNYDQYMHDGKALFHQVGTITKFLKWRSHHLKMDTPPTSITLKPQLV